MNSWWALLGLGAIPTTWWTINRVRVRYSAWRYTRNYLKHEIANKAQMPEPEPQDYCFGCDEIRPRSWMAFVDEDSDGMPDVEYRCRVCRGVVTPLESQKATDERIANHFANNRGDNIAVHEDDCQCTNCNGYQINPDQMWQDLTEEQVANLHNALFPEYNFRIPGMTRYAQAKRTELRAKYRMDTGEWRNHVRR